MRTAWLFLSSLALLGALAWGVDGSVAEEGAQRGPAARTAARSYANVGRAIVVEGARLIVAGHRVTVTDGRVRTPQGTLEGERIEILLLRARIWKVSGFGKASFESTRGVLFADVIVWDPRSGDVRARGAVRVFAPPDVVAFGVEFRYDGAGMGIELSGPVRVQSGQGIVAGSALRATRGLARVVVRGPVRFDYGEGSGQAQRAEVVPGDRIVVLEGDVSVQHGRHRLWADRVTVFYRDRRVVAEGVRRLLVDEEQKEEGS